MSLVFVETTSFIAFINPRAYPSYLLVIEFSSVIGDLLARVVELLELAVSPPTDLNVFSSFPSR